MESNIQQFIELAVDAIKKTHDQGAKSISEDGEYYCMYRNGNGLCCTVGHMIGDDFYESDFEKNSATDTFILAAVTKTVGEDFHNSLNFSEIEAIRSVLCNLQSAHDDTASGMFKGMFLYKVNSNSEFGNNLYQRIVERFNEKYPTVTKVAGE